MFGWRGRMAYIAPGISMFSSEFDRILPDGVICAFASLGLRKLVGEEFKKVSEMYLSAAQQLSGRGIGFIGLGGTSVWQYTGFDWAEQLANRIQETTGTPAMLYDTAVCRALKRLSARKVVAVSPWSKELMEKGTRVSLERGGFEVARMKGLGLDSNVETLNLPPYAAYRLAREAFAEAPEADAVYIQCPAWQVVGNIQSLEEDLGVPVVSAVSATAWAALDTMRIREPVRGYGKLFETL